MEVAKSGRMAAAVLEHNGMLMLRMRNATDKYFTASCADGS